MDLTRSEAAAQGIPVRAVTVAIRQSPAELRIETTQDGTSQAVRYVPVSANPPTSDGVGTFRWEGSQLVTNLATYINNQAVTVQEVRSLNSAGSEMTVKITLVVQHGYQLGAASPVQPPSPNTSSGTNIFLKVNSLQ